MFRFRIYKSFIFIQLLFGYLNTIINNKNNYKEIYHSVHICNAILHGLKRVILTIEKH